MKPCGRGVVLGVAIAVALGALGFGGPASAQAPCNRQCAADQRDSYGCCPAGHASDPSATTHASRPSASPAGACQAGQERTIDTQGHCCWPGQAWSGTQCVGAPTACPAGYAANAGAQACTLIPCAQGQERASDGAHCCWKGQAWSTVRSVCVGVPQCPTGWVATLATCLPPAPPGMVSIPPAPGMTPFAMDITDVTVSAYGACVAAGRCTPPGSTGDAGRDVACNWGKAGRESHPVNCVTWYDANAYCLWAGKRLPTASEWTWAAGGGTRTYPWGNDPPSNQLCWQRPLGADSSCPAGAFPGGATPEGVRDLAGNMAQWTSTDPDGTGQKRVTKGAFWGAQPANAQWLGVAFSGQALVGGRANGQSFRCVR